MKQLGMLIILFASLCCAQQSGDFQPSATIVWESEYPLVDDSGRVQIRIKAPEAMKIRVNFWSGPKVDMEKQPLNQQCDTQLLPYPSHYLTAQPLNELTYFSLRSLWPSWFKIQNPINAIYQQGMIEPN
jgi:hypothetical protein